MVGWYDMGLTKQRSWYEDGKWYRCTPEKAFDPFAIRINPEYITTIPEFRYSAVELYSYENTLKYLRTYRQYPEVEFITKLGLSNIALSKQILKLARESKAFRKWLGKNRHQLRLEAHDIKIIIDAFKTKKDMCHLQQIYNKRKAFMHESGLKDLRAFVRGETDKFLAYIEAQNTNYRSYDDYKRACEYLGIDMSIDKTVIHTILSGGTILELPNIVAKRQNVMKKTGKNFTIISEPLQLNTGLWNLIKSALFALLLNHQKSLLKKAGFYTTALVVWVMTKSLLMKRR